MRYELTDYEWVAITPFLPNKPRGVPRVNDRRVLNGIFGSCVRARRGAICRTILAPPPPASIALFAGAGLAVWDQLMNALTAGHDAAVQMIDTSIVRAYGGRGTVVHRVRAPEPAGE